MCPSFRATGEEQHSTRGRARLLHEMLAGEVVTGRLALRRGRRRARPVPVLQGLRSDCPVGVDMATYKAEFLHHHYAGRLRPAAHYAMGGCRCGCGWSAGCRRGWSTRLNARLAAAGLGWRSGRGGIAPRAATPARSRRCTVQAPAGGRRTAARTPAPRRAVRPAALARHLHRPLRPRGRRARRRGAGGAGLRASTLPPRPGLLRADLCLAPASSTAPARCCAARWTRWSRCWAGRARSSGWSRSCAAALRADRPNCSPTTRAPPAWPAASAPSPRRWKSTPTRWRPPSPPDRPVARPDPLPPARGARRRGRPDGCWPRWARRPRCATGCCGLAGNFGFERGHYEVSVACAEDQLLPAVRAAGPGRAVLADGFSCRTQLRQADTREPVHLAQLAARALGL